MLHSLSSFLGLSPAAVATIAVIVVVQIILQIYSLVDLARRPVVAGGRKWIWLIVILLGEFVGAIFYLALGRPATAVPETGFGDGEGGRAAADRALDSLYGPRTGA